MRACGQALHLQRLCGPRLERVRQLASADNLQSCVGRPRRNFSLQAMASSYNYKEVISTEKAPAAAGPYSQAIKTSNLIFVSGQVGLIPGGVWAFENRHRSTGHKKPNCEHTANSHEEYALSFDIRQTKDLAAEDVEGQTEQVMKNLGAVLEASGSSFEQVVKTTVLLEDMSHFGAVNAIYSRYFPGEPPARACYAVKQLPLGAKVEIEAVALQN